MRYGAAAQRMGTTDETDEAGPDAEAMEMVTAGEGSVGGARPKVEGVYRYEWSAAGQCW